MLHFHSPWAFLGLLFLPLWFAISRWHKGKRPTVEFSSLSYVKGLPSSPRQFLAWLPTALRVVALVLLVVALARPQSGREKIRDYSKGIAIEMVLDRSSSMRAEMTYKDKRVNRLELVKDVFSDFVFGDGKGLEGRENDLIGMISFARYPETVCPLTSAHEVLPHFLENVNLVQRESEDGTAIGDALALAVARLDKVQDVIDQQSRRGDEAYEIKSKVVILLSDGENNAGKRMPEQAAELAKEKDVKIYTVGMTGEALMQVQTFFGVQHMPVGGGADTVTLERVAETTGGKFFEVDDADALVDIYEEIDKLEKTEVQTLRYVDYREVFLWFALPALGLLLLEVVLRLTLFRRVP